MPMVGSGGGMASQINTVDHDAAVPAAAAVPVQVVQHKDGTMGVESGMSKVSILCKQGKFEELKSALNDIDVTGITVTQVLGCGTQKGNTSKYRGIELDMVLLPKIKVEVVVGKVPVSKVIEAATKALYTGHIGDGKIFVYHVENAVKVRTGEYGIEALQGSAEDYF